MKIELQPRTEEHVLRYFSRTRDAEIRRMLPGAARTAEEALRMFRAAEAPDATSYGRTIYADGRYVGDVWCYCIDLNESPNAMLSYCVFEKELWNRGIATEAVRQFLEQVREGYALHTMGAFTYADNTASIRVLERSGFTEQERFVEDSRESVYLEIRVDG